MEGSSLTIISLIFGGFFLSLLGVILVLKRSLHKKEIEIKKSAEESNRRLYELAILKEIGERTGYSLDVEEILNIIAGSLHQFISYSAVSYIVVGEKLKLNTHLEESVDKSFLNEMKERMLASLSALLEKEIDKGSVEEVVTGAISLDSTLGLQKVGSFFNIPLVISGKLAAILTIANVKEGLYKEEEMTILYKITGQASNAVTRLEEVVKTEEAKVLKVREEFTSMIVHELRSPLDGMRKIIELVVSGTIKKNSPQFKEYMGMVHQSSTSMLELVNDILDFSKLEAGKFEISKEKSSMREVIENRISFYQALADTKEIKLQSLIDKSTLEEASFDPHALKQVLNNFISNSLKFTKAGGFIKIISFTWDGRDFGEEVEKEISSMPVQISGEDIKLEGKSIVVAVFDSGLGISAEKQKDLFTSYKQAGHALDPDSRGTGLGLVIAQGIVKAHQGFISLKSEEGKGSVFLFAIPLG